MYIVTMNTKSEVLQDMKEFSKNIEFHDEVIYDYSSEKRLRF